MRPARLKAGGGVGICAPAVEAKLVARSGLYVGEFGGEVAVALCLQLGRRSWHVVEHLDELDTAYLGSPHTGVDLAARRDLDANRIATPRRKLGRGDRLRTCHGIPRLGRISALLTRATHAW